MSYFNKKRFTLDKDLRPCQGQVIGLLTVVFLGITAIAYSASIPNSFSNGQTISSGAVNQNFQALADAINTGDVACPSSMLRSGSVCIDKYEASVWETTNAALIAKIKAGTATLTELQANATQRGASSDNYGAGCPDTGNGCKDFYAVSVAGVTPSRYITWFQAAAAARNSGKRLPTNQEWQVAALGTPDNTNCNVSSGVGANTGANAGCVSDVGAYDMVGNLWEWVADWVPFSTACPGWGGFSDDYMCLSGASTIATGPGALFRGGYWSDGTSAGVFAVNGFSNPTDSSSSIGFRCVR